MGKFTFFILYLVCVSQPIWAQNLIQNPSFESYVHCPVALGTLNADVAEWTTPTNGSTDYFNRCSKAMGAPRNFNGEQSVGFGSGYVGLYMYAPEDYREYIQIALSSALQKNEKYQLSFYVSLAERSDFAVDHFGVQFTETQVSLKKTKNISKKDLSAIAGNTTTYLEMDYDDFYTDVEKWVKVTKEFVANGTEKNMIIGNFKDNKRTRTFNMRKNTTKGSYYYLDMVVLEPLESKVKEATLASETMEKENFRLDSVHTFQSVLFAFDTFEILPVAKRELRAIAKYMTEKPEIRITIIGHTDGVGNTVYNTTLSLSRAVKAGEFLIANGIAKERISCKGLGSREPKFTNDTPENRKVNRRVEFVFANR